MRRNRAKAAVACAADLPPDMLANIHGRLSPLDRLVFAAAFPASRGAFRPEAPWLVLPGGDNPETATLFSLSDRSAATLRVPEPALRGHVVLGSSSSSSGGWLVTADDRAQIRLVDPVTGEQRALPAITTIPCLLEKWGGFSFLMLEPKDFLRGPPYPVGGNRPPQGTFTIGAELMRRFFYRKVVLSDSSPGSAAMLITAPQFGIPAFATAEGGGWRLAPSRDGVEDAVHYNGKFHSITYTGAVEAWEQDANAGGLFTSAVVAPRLPNADGDSSLCCKYLVAAPGGRLMVVLKESKETRDEYSCPRRTCSFKVQVLDGEQWKETDDIGDAALFVGVNSSLCVSTREHPELRAGCVYYTENDLGPCKDGHNADEDNGVGVFSLKDGRAEKVEGLGQHRSWPPPAWFIPSIP